MDKRPLKVFLCHASADKPAVRNLYNRLVADGVDAWLDAENLVAGQNWQVEIPKAIRESDVVIVCLSEKSINKEGYVQREIKFALDVADEKPEGTIFIIPAKLEECKVPDRLSLYHWVKLYEKDGYERLVRALRLRADKIGATLHIKKNWLPNVSPSPKKSAEVKKPITQEEKPVALKPKVNIQIAYWIGGFIVLILGIIFLSSLNNSPFTSQPTPEITKTQASATLPQNTVKPSATSTPESTSTPSVKLTPTSLPTEITDAKGVSMMLVPAGEFTMGSDDYDSWESPAHMVYIDAFYIDKYEVTNTLYKMCVEVGACIQPNDIVRYTNPKYNNHPVVYVNWKMSSAYCEWRGARLPTEAEWEKAARGTSNSTYPWGETIDCSYANYYGANGNCVGDTTEAGKYENGKSVYGVYDMAGNVFEWVSSLSKSYPYEFDDGREDQDSPLKRIVRGGSWNNIKESIRSTKRTEAIPLNFNYYYGFRCAKSVTTDTPIASETPAGGYEIITMPTVAYRGGTVIVEISTQPGTECALGFILPSGQLSQAAGTGPDTADENGVCFWTWKVASNVNTGRGSIFVEAGGKKETYPIEIK